MSFGHFQHKPLDLSRRQIRLVRLRRQDGSSQHNSRLRCEVQHFDMDDPDMPAYRALSYVWGNKSPHFYLRINDEWYVVRRNLYDFLCELQDREQREDWFWVDQLCIAQYRTEERNHQVSLMAEIFKRAKSVVAWLGKQHEQSKDSDILLDLIAIVDELVATTQLNHRACLTEAESDAILALCDCAYWRRLWIVQEVKLAADLSFWWGSNSFARVKLRRLWQLADFMRLKLPAHANTARIAWLLGTWIATDLGAESRLSTLSTRTSVRPETESRGLLLIAVLEKVGASECEDTRDIIFGIQALVRPTSRIDVDYDRPVARVVEDAVLVMLAELALFQTRTGERVEDGLTIVEALIMRMQPDSPLLSVLHNRAISATILFLHRQQRDGDVTERFESAKLHIALAFRQELRFS